MDFPELNTDRLLLNEIQASDADAIFELFSSAQVVAYYDLDIFSDRQQAHDLIGFFQTRFESGNGIRWAIRLKETKQMIGSCGFNTWNPKMRNAVIGYDLMPAFWGRGLALEAVGKIIDVAFTGELPCGALHRIQADTVPGNTASEKLLNKLGFKEEGLRRDSGFWKGRYHDLKCFGLLKTER